MKSHCFLFGGGSFYPLRVAPDVKIFFDRLVLANSQKKFDLGRSPKIGQTRVIPNSRKKIFEK